MLMHSHHHRRRTKKKPQPVKIVIEIDGGVFCSAYTDTSAPVEIVLIDHDNMKEEGKGYKERTAIIKEATKGLKAIY